MANNWTCNVHGSAQSEQQECPSCRQDFEARRPAEEMTGDERAAEMQRWGEQCSIRFGDIHLRVTELVGRDVYTHEMAAWGELVEEARTRQNIGLADVLAKLPGDMPLIILEAHRD